MGNMKGSGLDVEHEPIWISRKGYSPSAMLELTSNKVK